VSASNGTAGNAAIVGPAGADTFIGGAGGDTITGGGGVDIFKYTATSDGGVSGDTINDFTLGVDKFAFLGIAFTSTAAAGQTLNSADFSTSASATEGTYFVFNTTNNTLYWDADGVVGGSVGIAIAVVDTDANAGTPLPAPLAFTDITIV